MVSMTSINSAEVLVIIPTYRHLKTLPFAVASAQQQTIQNIEIVVIGDGTTDEFRDVMKQITEQDSRVKFLEFPKSQRHGEEYRDQVIKKSDAKYIAYLGDDDLFFPNHLEIMLREIQGFDFVNPLPIFIGIDGALDYIPGDLSIPESLDWHLDEEINRNSISLTGVVHTRESYLRLPFGWRTTPAGIPTDHYMWRQFFQLSGFRGTTVPKATTAKFPAWDRADQEINAKEQKEFQANFSKPGFQETWDMAVQRRISQEAVRRMLGQYEQGGDFQADFDRIESEHQALLNNTHTHYQNSLSWKITAPLRKLHSFFKKTK